MALLFVGPVAPEREREPRSTMPINTSESGMCSSVPSRANAGGKQVKSRTIARMSHT